MGWVEHCQASRRYSATSKPLQNAWYSRSYSGLKKSPGVPKEWWQSVSVTSQALPRTQTVLIESKIDRNCTSGSSGMLWRVGPRDLLNFFRIFIQNRVFPCSMAVMTDLYFSDDFQILHDVNMILGLGSHQIIWRSEQSGWLWPTLTAKSPLTTYLLGHSSCTFFQIE